MARERRSLFEWLTGSQGEADYSFDELEQGGSSYPAASARQDFPVQSSRRASQVPMHAAAEEEVEDEPAGELAVDVYQTPTHVVIKAMIAGVKPDDLDVAITRDTLTIRGKRERHTEGTAGDFYFQELYWGAFSRTIQLPQEVEVEGAEATEKHGLLTIRLPRIDRGRQAKLKVKSS